MLRVFQNDIQDLKRFVITMELVPGREPAGRSVDAIKAMAADAFADGRISAVSITDNPGGNPALSPDVIGHDIFKVGMDVIVHFTCRDGNRIGMESRALQLAMMGMKNILALTGDYIGKGFAGQGAPVFDLDSVTLLVMLRLLGRRVQQAGDPDMFFAGCAVSPFKNRRGEALAQYAKLCRKVAAGARFAVTQLGYDTTRFKELMDVLHGLELELPTLGSVYVLTPVSARIMNAGQVPGAVVSNELMKQVLLEWQDRRRGRDLAIERAARLGAVLKGMGYRGIHIAGVHRGFDLVGRILDRMAQIEDQWRDFLDDFSPKKSKDGCSEEKKTPSRPAGCSNVANLSLPDKLHFRFLKGVHNHFFNFDGRLATLLHLMARRLGQRAGGRLLVQLFEDPFKKLLLDCRRCGDCAIQHVAFLCPESQCPKHIRNGACGGSRNGCCEVYPERKCVWFRAWERWNDSEQPGEMITDCIPPRLWELDGTSSWLNFHLRQDHQSASGEILQACRDTECRIPPSICSCRPQA
jgi:methylenetetrahydrofolate reductase (NADPH)